MWSLYLAVLQIKHINPDLLGSLALRGFHGVIENFVTIRFRAVEMQRAFPSAPDSLTKIPCTHRIPSRSFFFCTICPIPRIRLTAKAQNLILPAIAIDYNLRKRRFKSRLLFTIIRFFFIKTNSPKPSFSG